MTARYVVLGLAPARCPWFREVARWAHAGTVPVEFVKCVSAEEVRARLAGSRPHSALLIDASTVDRDLVAAAGDAGTSVIAVGPTPLATTSTLDVAFTPAALVEALTRHTRQITRADHPASPPAVGRRAALIAVTGPGGTGASTAAIALAQGLAPDCSDVLLADLRRDAEQAMLHDAGDVIPGIDDLVDAFRRAAPAPELVRSMTFAVPERGYQLLLGLRRSHGWATMRPAAFAAALDALRRHHAVVVADTDADVEGEDGGGSIDVEERNVMARTACATADVVLVIGAPGMKGTHSLARVVLALFDLGVTDRRVIPVVNRSPRHPRMRAELATALHRLMPATATVGGPIFLPSLPPRRVDDALRDGVRLPQAMCAPLVGAVRAVAGVGPPAADTDPVRRVRPGRLGAWRLR